MFRLRKHILNSNATDTIIGESTIVEGKIISDSSLRIDGKVTGEIECTGNVIVGEHGSIHSNVTANNVINAGLIEGIVQAKDAFTLTPTGKMIGTISAVSLIIVEGGMLQGTSKMAPKPVKEHIIEHAQEIKSSGTAKKEKARVDKATAAG